MLKSIIKNREHKTHQKTEELIRKGVVLIEGKLYKQAMIEFQNAFELEPRFVSEKLQKEFNEANSVSDFEAALSIGLVLIKMKKDDYELANTLGNCARKQKNYKQANNLYRHSLKIKKSYVNAFYNLAASMGRVDKYDQDIKESLRVFDKVKKYILPDYYGNTNFIVDLIEELSQKNEDSKAERILNLQLEITQKEEEGEINEAEKLKHELTLEEKTGKVLTHEQICNHIRQQIKQLEEDLSEEDRDDYHGLIHNLGLYALSKGDSEVALECFQNLKSLKASFKYLNMYIAIAKNYSGDLKEALNIFIEGLGTEQNNRFYNVNLGLMYKKAGNKLLSTKYLAIGAALLEKSDGLYHLSDLIKIADENLENGNLKKALKLYNIITEEKDDQDIWSSIGEIYMNMGKYELAVDAYREILRIDPESKHAKLQIGEIHDIYHIRGDAFFRDSKFKAAATMFERALRVKRTEESIRSAIAVYKLLKNHNRVDELNEELEEIQKKVLEVKNESIRLEHIQTGKISLKRKDYKQAIESFELAFRMKLDKDVFVYLATIYKAMKRTEEMQHLLERWNKMVEHDDKIKKFEKQEGRDTQ